MSKRTRNAAESRRKALQGARRLMLQKGYHGVSMKDIAVESGVGQSLIHHHFETKAHLWRATLEAIFEEVARDLRGPLMEATRGNQFAEAFVRAYARYCLERPEYVRVLAWLIAQQESPPEALKGRSGPFLGVIEAAQAKGQIRRDRTPEEVMTLLWGLVEGVFLAAPQHHFRLGLEGALLNEKSVANLADAARRATVVA